MKKVSRKVSFSTPIGLLGGLGLIVLAMYEAAEGHLAMFFNLPSLLIIVGGTVASLVVSFPVENLKTLPSVIMIAFRNNSKNINLMQDIEMILDFAYIARREGILALEDNLEKYSNDPFLAKGVGLLLDGADDETFELFLQTELVQAKQRHNMGCSMVGFVAATAPSLGLVGTYAGLIPMLNSLDDPTSLGPLMALELCSSFYGAIIAYLIFAPLAKRLKSIADAESARNRLLLEGLINIRSGINPKLIQENLLAYVSKTDVTKSAKKGKNRRITTSDQERSATIA